MKVTGTYAERVDNGNDTVIMVDPEVDSQPLFESEERFQPFPDTQSQDYADSDPVRVFTEQYYLVHWYIIAYLQNSIVEANMQPVGLHWLNSDADDLAEDDDVVYDSQEPMIIPDSSQDDVVEGMVKLSFFFSF